jgi:tetratricopeptide (TPR) repeat protein
MKKFITLCIFLGVIISIFAQNDAYQQLQEAAGTNSGYIPPVNGPTILGDDANNSYTNNANAQIIANYQTKAVSINNEGVVYHNSGNYNKAIRYYKKALWYNPYSEVARNNLKNARNAQKIYNKNKRITQSNNREAKRINKKVVKEQNNHNNQQNLSQLAILEAKPNTNTDSEQDLNAKIEAEKAVQDLEEAQYILTDLKSRLNKTNRLLKTYSKSLANNSQELDTWAEMVDKTYKNTLNVSKEYFTQMFMKYNLLTNFDPKYKNGPYLKLKELLSSTDPKKSTWLINEFADKHLNPSDVEYVVGLLMLNNDAKSLTSQMFDGNSDKTKTNLDAVLFVNSIFESAKWIKYDDLKDAPFFRQMANGKNKTMPGEWFTQAKVIGEVYSDLVVQCVSWNNINRLNEDNAAKIQKVNLLIYSQERTVEQIKCIENSIKDDNLNNVNKCIGKTKLHTPPPFLY